MKDNVNFDQDTTNAATRKFRVINVHLRLSDWVSMLGGERLIGLILKVPMPSPNLRTVAWPGNVPLMINIHSNQGISKI